PCALGETAYALFERSLADGKAIRRSEGQSMLGGRVEYDRTGALLVWGLNPVFRRKSEIVPGTIMESWSHIDSTGRSSITSDTGGTYRLAPGEKLPAWPLKPLEPKEVSRLLRSTSDGRYIAWGTLDPNPLSALDWYTDKGMPRTP